MTKGKFLAVDYGTKRIGIAISDEGGTLAFPREIIPNDKFFFKAFAEILKKEKISQIVVGESTDFSGKPNPVSGRIKSFIVELEKRFSLPVHKQKEFLTSVEARKFKTNKKETSLSQTHSRVKNKKTSRADASAAALILQRYLDRINK